MLFPINCLSVSTFFRHSQKIKEAGFEGFLPYTILRKLIDENYSYIPGIINDQANTRQIDRSKRSLFIGKTQKN